MPKRINFTKPILTKAIAEAAGTRVDIHDSKTGGLLLSLREGGGASFYFYGRAGGRPRRVKLGDWPEMTCEQARKKLVATKADLERGTDPVAIRRVARGEKNLGDLFGHYLETHAKVHKKTWRYDEQQYDRYLAAWKTRRLTSITHADVVALHVRIGDKNGHYAANRLLALLHTLFEVAGKNQTEFGFTKPNPASGVQRFKEKSRERFLQGDELPRFFEALKAEPNPTIRDYFFLSLLTGAERGNMLRMQWNELSISRGVWSVPDSKSGEALSIALPPAALEVLKRRKAENDAADNPSVWVFPGHIRGSHLTTAQRNWTELCKRADLENIRIHDLRRTLGSWQAAAGTSLAIIGKSLGHKNIATTAIYARLNLDPVQASVNVAVSAMLATIPKEAPAQSGQAPAIKKPKGKK